MKNQRKQTFLTPEEFRKLPEGTYTLGLIKGLYIRKRNTHSGYFFLRFTDPQKRRRDFTLGPYPETDTNEVIVRACQARADISKGIDPFVKRKDERLEKGLLANLAEESHQGWTIVNKVDTFF